MAVVMSAKCQKQTFHRPTGEYPLSIYFHRGARNLKHWSAASQVTAQKPLNPSAGDIATKN
jgi:hypothetical protein